MVKSPQIADQIIPRNGDNASPYYIPYDFSTTGYVQVSYSDREHTTKWTVLVENIDYTVSLNLGQGLVYLTDPDSLVDFNFLRLKRIRPAAQPDIYPNAYSGPGLEGKADNHMEITQQNTSTIDLLEDRDPLDIVPPNNFVDRFTVINSLDPNRLSGSSLEETESLIKAYKDTTIEGSVHIQNDLTVGQNISASSNISASQNITAGTTLTVAQNATVGGSLSVTGNAIITANLSVSQDITCNNLTVAINANLNYIYANSAVVTVIETNDIVSDKGTISNLETVSHISNDVSTDRLTVTTSFTIPNTCEFVSNGERFGWYMDFTDPTKTNLIIETVNGRTVIKNESFPSIPVINVDQDYIVRGGPNGELINSSMTDDGTTAVASNIVISEMMTFEDDAILRVNNADLKWALDITDTQATNLRLDLDGTGHLVITNDLMPSGGVGDINVLNNRIAKGATGNALVSSNISDDGATVTVDIDTNIAGNLSCGDLNTTSITDDGATVTVSVDTNIIGDLSCRYLNTASINDDGTTVTIGVNTNIVGNLSCGYLNTASISDTGNNVNVSKSLGVTGDITATNSITAPNIEAVTYLSVGYAASMVTNGAVFSFEFVGDFETKPYLVFYRTIEGQLKVTNTALPSVDVASKYDSSGILSGFGGTFVGDTVTIGTGTGVVWDGATYQEIIMSAPINIQVSTTNDSYVFLRWDGTDSLEAYTQATPPSNTQKVQDIYLYFITAHDGAVFNLFNRFRNLNQQLEQVIDILGLAVPYSNMALTLTEGTANFVRTAGNFKAFGIKNVPSTTAKYDTSTIFSITDNAPVFSILDINRGNSAIDLTEFPFPPQYLDNDILTAIPADSWGYYEVLVNAYGQVRFIYPIDVFVSIEPNSGNAQQSLKDLTAIKDFKVDGFAVIGMLGLKGGSTTFESGTAIFYQNVAQVGGAATVVEINLPDPNQFDAGYRMTAIDVGGGFKEWYGMPDNVKTANVGQEAYYDTTGTVSGRDSRIKTAIPGQYAQYDSTGLSLIGVDLPVYTSPVKTGTVGKPAYYDTSDTVSSSNDLLVPNPTIGQIAMVLGVLAEGSVGWVAQPSFTSNVKPGTVGTPAIYDSNTTVSSSNDLLVPNPTIGQVAMVLGVLAEGTVGWVAQPSFTSNVKPGTIGNPAIYDSDTTVSSSNDKLAPNPTAGDVNKILGATAEGVVGWIDAPTSGGSGIINPGTIGAPAVYTAEEEVGSSTNLLVTRPQAVNSGQVYTALGEGSAGWTSLSGAIDQITITKIISDSQQTGDILTTLSKRRLFNSGTRIYDDYSRREILALNGQTISLKQYMGFGLKADIIDAAPQPGEEPPEPIQGTGVSDAAYRHVRFCRTPTNEKYVLEILGDTWNGAVTGVHLGRIDPKTGAITRIHTNTSWPSSGSPNHPQYFGIFFVVDVVNNYYAYNVYTASAGSYHTYFYNLATGAEIHQEITNKWDIANIPAYITKNDHLYVFYPRNRATFVFDRIKVQDTAPYFTVVQDAVIINSTYQFDIILKMMDESTGLLSSLRYVSGTNYPSNVTFNFDTNSPGTFYTSVQPSNRPLCFGGIFYNNKYSVAYYITNGQANQRFVITPGTGTWEVINNLPGVANVGYSVLDQHPKYTNICACLKNDKRQLFISYDYGETWIEKTGFNAATQFWTTLPPGTTGAAASIYTPSTTIWLDNNNTSMIFAGWLQNGGTNAPCAIQPLGATAGEATLPVWQDGAYIISTEFQYLPVTWFDAGGGKTIGETYHSRRLPLAKTVTGGGEITTIDWTIGTTPPDTIVGFACSDTTIGSWAISDTTVYYAANGYSFGAVFTTGENVFLSHVAYYDEDRCLVATYQTEPFNATNIALVDTNGNVEVIYNVSSPYPVVSDLVVTDYYIVFSRVGINQVVWADRGDLIFGAVIVGAEIKKIASAGLTTHGLSINGTVIYQWSGKGESELALRSFSGGTIINDIVSEQSKLFAVGYTGTDGDAYMYNYSDWTDYVGIGTANHFNVVEISTTSIQDVIIGSDNGFFQSSDGFATEPIALPIDVDSTQPLGIKLLAIDTTKAFTVFFGIDENDQGFNYRAGDVNTSIITDLMEHKYNSTIIGTSPMGYIVLRQPGDDFWTRKIVGLIPTSTYTQRQTIAEGLDGTIYIQDDEGHIGVSADNGETFNVAAASPVGVSGRGGGFIGNLLGNYSIMALNSGNMIKSQDDWATSVEWTPFNPDQVCTYFSRDLARDDIVYAAVSQQGTGSNVCRVERFNATDDWTAPTTLLDVTLTDGRYFTRIASYNDRIVVIQSDGAFRYSIDNGLTWSIEDTSLVDNPVITDGVTSVWIENTTDCVYIAKTGGLFYNTFIGIENSEPWIQEDVPVSADQPLGAHFIDKKRSFGIIGNIGVNIYWRRYDT